MLVKKILLYPTTFTSHIAQYFLWLGPLLARVIVGEVFMTSGWGKLNNLPFIIENFAGWGIPHPEILTPFVAGLEWVGGIALIAGLYTRLFSGMLAVTMLVAIKSALWEQVDSLDTLLGFSESAYFAIFTWLATAGAGKISIDYWLTKKQ